VPPTQSKKNKIQSLTREFIGTINYELTEQTLKPRSLTEMDGVFRLDGKSHVNRGSAREPTRHRRCSTDQPRC